MCSKRSPFATESVNNWWKRSGQYFKVAISMSIPSMLLIAGPMIITGIWGEALASSPRTISATSVADMANNLCSNLEAARSHFVIGRLFAETVQRCCDLLDVVISQAQPFQSSGQPLLEQTLDDRYTMRAERQVHDAAARGWTSLPAEAETSDEVEFF